MTVEELDDEIKSNNSNIYYFKRLIAMKLISYGLTYKDVSEILLIGYRTLYRWAKTCEESGIKSLIPNFNGGRKSKFTEEERNKFKKILRSKGDISMTEAQHILKEEIGHDFSLPYVCKLVRDLGFNYGSPRPEYKEEPENAEEILKKTSKKQI